MKKICSAIMIAILASAMLMMFTFAPLADGETVYVTISNGSLVLTEAEVTLADADGDGKKTVNDALILAHEAYFDGTDAYASSESEYGLSLTKLWGVGGGAYGYYVNNVGAMSLLDELSGGDYVNAFVYTDTVAYSDAYSYFDKRTATDNGTGITLTLNALSFDSNWNTVVLPVAGAVIIIDGKDTQYKTDENGTVTLKLEAGKQSVISARSDTQTLVPPVCMASNTESPATGDVMPTLLTALAFCVLVTIVTVRKNA